MRLIDRVGKDDETLCHCAVQISNGSNESLPSKDGQPSYVSEVSYTLTSPTKPKI